MILFMSAPLSPAAPVLAWPLEAEGVDCSGGPGPASGPRVGPLPHDGYRPAAGHGHRLQTAAASNHRGAPPPGSHSSAPSQTRSGRGGGAASSGRASGSGGDARPRRGSWGGGGGGRAAVRRGQGKTQNWLKTCCFEHVSHCSPPRY